MGFISVQFFIKQSMKHFNIVYICVIYLIVNTAQASNSTIDAQYCAYYYSQFNLPQQCTNQTNECIFDNGFQVLTNQTKQDYQFYLCLDLPSYYIQVSLTNQTLYESIQSIFIAAFNLYIDSGYFLHADQAIVLQIDQRIVMKDSGLFSLKNWIQADEIQIINCTLVNNNLLETDCNCVDQIYCSEWSFKFPSLYQGNTHPTYQFSLLKQSLNFQTVHTNSLVIAANASIKIVDTNLRSSIIGIFSNNLTLQYTLVDTSALGFSSSYGEGCGYYDEVLHQLLNCMGTGGSHGGFGGNSFPQNCYLLMSKTPYGSIENPFSPGSGGGFFIPNSKQSSSGGGIINVQTKLLNITHSFLNSEGKNGIQGGGGGAGGTISIQYFNLTAKSCNISVNGGNGQKSSSGSGGRIRLYNYNWRYQEQSNISSQLIITAFGGKLCPRNLSCGETGSIFTSPCRPGFQLSKNSYLCKRCLPGTYQITYGYSSCISCSEIPDNAHFTPNNTFPENYTSACSFQCNPDYYLFKGYSCLKQGERALQMMGGDNFLICLGLVVGAILIFFLVMVFKKLSQNESFSNNENQMNSNLLIKSYFRVEDIPFHELRIYIDGSNQPFNPWRIDEKFQANFFSELKNPMTKINHILSKAIKQINTVGNFTKFQKILVTSFRYIYYPLSKLILGAIRRKKAKTLFTSINNLNKKIPDFQNLEIKFNIKPQMTACSIQIFNYTKSVLDFYIQNYYPLFFMLQKAPFGGYSIDFSDPFLKVFINQISQRDNTEKQALQSFFLELNKLLKTPKKFFPLINQLWSLKDTFPHLQAYLWQPPNIILGIDKEYTINPKKPLFLMISSQNINTRHFIFSEDLPCIYYTQIQCLKNKFTIRKQVAFDDERNTIWIIQNNFSINNLFGILGFLSALSFLFSIASFFLVIYVAQTASNFYSGVILFFVLWPLCDFGVVVFSFRTIMTKNEYRLADAIHFNLTALIKCFILFLMSLIAGVIMNSENNNEIEVIMIIWLTQFLINGVVLILQLMIRIHIV